MLRSRWLSLPTGRFLTKDFWPPDYSTPSSLNGWLYTNGNPVNYTDPSGHVVCLWGVDPKTGECKPNPLSTVLPPGLATAAGDSGNGDWATASRRDWSFHTGLCRRSCIDVGFEGSVYGIFGGKIDFSLLTRHLLRITSPHLLLIRTMLRLPISPPGLKVIRSPSRIVGAMKSPSALMAKHPSGLPGRQI